jgi:NADH-quinone oxidoreductase subunit M
MLFVLSSLALPLTSGFTAEFLVLFGAFSRGLAAWRAGSGALLLVAALLASTSIVLGATYMLRFARALLFGKNADPLPVHDIGLRESLPLIALLLVVLWVGIAPAPIMSKVQNIVSQLARINRPEAPPLSFLAPAIATGGSTHGR